MNPTMTAPVSPLPLYPRCLCSPGWTGVDCAEDVNECDSGPCLNGAQCQESDVPGEFSCTCPPFFSGPLCNQPYDPCDPLHNPCLNNSTCLTRSNGTASCRCPAGEWTHRHSLILPVLLFFCSFWAIFWVYLLGFVQSVTIRRRELNRITYKFRTPTCTS